MDRQFEALASHMEDERPARLEDAETSALQEVLPLPSDLCLFGSNADTEQTKWFDTERPLPPATTTDRSEHGVTSMVGSRWDWREVSLPRSRSRQSAFLPRRGM